MASPITVLAVDDRAVFLRAARELIAATPGFEQVGEAHGGPEALELAAELHPDLVLVDVRMPGMDGVETAHRLGTTAPEAVVVLVSVDPVTDLRTDAPSAFAHEFVRKQDLSTGVLCDLWKRHRRDPDAA